MRTIDRERRELIDALVGEGLARLPAGVLEKDVHVTDALHALARIRFGHGALVFCGGTSLSKAYGLIERMSEDIDLKIALADDHGLSRNALRKHLGEFRDAVIGEMKALDFGFVETESRARNDNHYFASGWLYASQYDGHDSLRPHIKLEFTVRTPCFPVEQKPIGYLVDRLANELASRKSVTVDMACLAVAETLAEKVLSFLRRHAENRAGVRADWDPTLVRHLYDAYCIVSADPSAITQATRHFGDLVALDIKEFPKHAGFAMNPKQCMTDTLAIVKNETQTRQEYEEKLQPLIYGSTRADFGKAFSVFETAARALIATLL